MTFDPWGGGTARTRRMTFRNFGEVETEDDLLVYVGDYVDASVEVDSFAGLVSTQWEFQLDAVLDLVAPHMKRVWERAQMDGEWPPPCFQPRAALEAEDIGGLQDQRKAILRELLDRLSCPSFDELTERRQEIVRALIQNPDRRAPNADKVLELLEKNGVATTKASLMRDLAYLRKDAGILGGDTRTGYLFCRVPAGLPEDLLAQARAKVAEQGV